VYRAIPIAIRPTPKPIITAAGIRLNPIPTPTPMIRHPTNMKLPKPAFLESCEFLANALPPKGISPKSPVNYTTAFDFSNIVSVFLPFVFAPDESCDNMAEAKGQ
jgi:hypothetical protein